MNGAESLVKTLLGSGINVCFTNPGTSEMHFVAALDAHQEMRCVLGLQENIVTGAADGYMRMTDKPAATLLHLGPGLTNAMANIHNADRARSSMFNIVGDHATYHKQYDAPLTSDIEAIAHPLSDWVHTSKSADEISKDTVEAIEKANQYPGQISTLILPADTAWNETDQPVEQANAAANPRSATQDQITKCADIIRSGEPVLLLIGGRCLREEPQKLAAKIAAFGSNVEIMAESANARFERGAGLPEINRIPYPADMALEATKKFKHAILLEAREPVLFFAYPGKPSLVLPEECQVHGLAGMDMDGPGSLEMLVAELGCQDALEQVCEPSLPALTKGKIDPETLGPVIAHAIPENGIIVDEAITSGRMLFASTSGAPRHSWLQIGGGAIGIGIPLAIGASIAAPDRPVLALQADGSAMYTVQGFWTQARENLNITTVIFHNRSYNILKGEMKNVGVEEPGPSARNMLELDQPDLDWIAIAAGMGVKAVRADNCETLLNEIRKGLESQGPYLIEAYM